MVSLLLRPRILFIHSNNTVTLSRLRRRFLSSAMAEMDAEPYKFGPYKISKTEVFHSTPLSFAMVNLRPVVPGHILLQWSLCHFLALDMCTKMYFVDFLFCYKMAENTEISNNRREVKRFIDLTAEETSDLWLTAKNIGGKLEHYHKASSLTFCIQDGPQAGQTVPHVHIHILPRKKDDFENNDEIYDAIDVKERELKEKLDLDKERKDRSLEEMTQEADDYRVLFS